MALRADADAILDVGRVVAAESQDLAQRALDHAVPRRDKCVRICSWCKRVLVCQRWEEIEVAIADLDLMRYQEMPELKHGVCPECLAIVQSART